MYPCIASHVHLNVHIHNNLTENENSTNIVSIANQYVSQSNTTYMCLRLYIVLKARHLSDSAFCTRFVRLEVPEQALGGIPLGFGLVVEDKPTDFSCTCLIAYTNIHYNSDCHSSPSNGQHANCTSNVTLLAALLYTHVQCHVHVLTPHHYQLRMSLNLHIKVLSLG